MFDKFLIRSVIVLMTAALLAASAQAVTMDTVPVGNPGNGNDDTGYGSVATAYSIGQYEVTAGQYTEFLNAVAATDTYGLYNSDMWSDSYEYGCKIEQTGTPGNYSYSVAANRADRPVNYVSWGDAARFCNWLHNGQPSGPQGDGTTEDGAYDLGGAITDVDLMAIARESDATWFIPTEDEWYKAAYHKNDGVTANYFDYPTSSDSVPSNDLINPDPGNNANFEQSGYTIGSPYWTTEVGEFEHSKSPYDTLDQGGNLWEWNETVLYGSERGVRGGGWYYYSGYLAASSRSHGYPSYEDASIGFRVATVPEPGSITLLLCGLLALISLRRRK